MNKLETPLWMLQYTFYAFMSAMFGFIFLGILSPLIRERFEERKTKKIEEKRALESLRTEYARCVDIVRKNNKGYVKENESASLTAKLYEQNILGENLKFLKNYKNKFKNPMKSANVIMRCVRVLNVSLEKLLKQKLESSSLRR